MRHLAVGKWRLLRRCSELAVGVAICVLGVRGWLVPAQIQGHSMAPSLEGPHHEADCDTCGETLAFAIHRPAHRFQLRCPRCGPQWLEAPQARARGGESVWIDRTAFWFRTPERWEVVTYRATDGALHVKRIVGLPQERVTLRHGDVFVNGHIARKEFHHWQRLTQRVAAGFRSWQGDGWRKQKDTARLSPAERIEPSSGDRTPRLWGARPLCWLAYRPGSGELLNDDIPFNVGLSRLLHPIRDLGASFQLEGTAPAILGIRISDGFQHFELRLRLGQRKIQLWHDGLVVSLPPLESPLTGSGDLLEVALCDAQLWLALNGRVVARYLFAPPAGEQPPGTPNLAFGGWGGLLLSEPRVWRDIYYERPEAGGQTPGQQVDHYFVLGDNSPVSRDSRTPEIGRIPANSIIGKVLCWHW